MSEEIKKFILPESAIPTGWINIMADAPGEPLPPLSPATGEPAGPDDLSAIFPMIPAWPMPVTADPLQVGLL